MGGTFNPIHIGHLIVANEVLENLKLDKVIFIPTGKPPHKDINNIEDSIDRYNMVNIAIEDNKKFEISDMEIKRQGLTYTIDTLKELNNKYKESKFYFVIGYDTLKELSTWRDFKNLYRYAEFVVVDRNSNEDEIKEYILYYKKECNLVINYIKIPNIEISSTMIRED